VPLTNKIPVYLMPGMAASPRIFEYLNLPEEYQVIKLSWMTPEKDESLAAYAKRMSKRIEHKNPVLLGVSKTTGAHKLLPTQWIKSLESLALFVFGPSIRPKVESYQKYLSERDPAYLDPEVIHIHGDKDVVFPIKNIDTSNHFYRIKNATHAMILTHHAWFNKNLPNIIEK